MSRGNYFAVVEVLFAVALAEECAYRVLSSLLRKSGKCLKSPFIQYYGKKNRNKSVRDLHQHKCPLFLPVDPDSTGSGSLKILWNFVLPKKQISQPANRCGWKHDLLGRGKEKHVNRNRSIVNYAQQWWRGASPPPSCCVKHSLWDSLWLFLFCRVERQPAEHDGETATLLRRKLEKKQPALLQAQWQ